MFRNLNKIKKQLTGDVAVMVGAMVVLQERHQGVQEVMWTQEHQFLQNIWKNKGTET